MIGAFVLSVQGLGLCESAARAGEAGVSVPVALPIDEYLVSQKDVLQITIVGETDLPTNFEVSERDGTIKYPYIEYVKVVGLTVQQIEKLVTGLLKPDWYVEPGVNAMVVKYTEKLCYVQGKVNKPGQFSFTGQNKMTVYRAIIKAGGFADNANEKKVRLTTTDDKGRPVIKTINVADIMKKTPALDPQIKANDIIDVPESFF